VLPLKQSAGSAVRLRADLHVGARVCAGELLGDVAEKELGAALHASVAGTIAEINTHFVALACEVEARTVSASFRAAAPSS
jgi:Na+-translocating ferredoxin:NAD+ oxidoreductase RnfC subunit